MCLIRLQQIKGKFHNKFTRAISSRKLTIVSLNSTYYRIILQINRDRFPRSRSSPWKRLRCRLSSAPMLAEDRQIPRHPRRRGSADPSYLYFLTGALPARLVSCHCVTGIILSSGSPCVGVGDGNACFAAYVCYTIQAATTVPRCARSLRRTRGVIP